MEEAARVGGSCEGEDALCRIGTHLVHELCASKDRGVLAEASKRAVEIVDDHVLRAVAVHRDALGRGDPLAKRRVQRREMGARVGVNGRPAEEERRDSV